MATKELNDILGSIAKQGVLVDCGIPTAEHYLPGEGVSDLETSDFEFFKHVRNGRVHPVYYFHFGPIQPLEPNLWGLSLETKDRILPDPGCLFVEATFPLLDIYTVVKRINIKDPFLFKVLEHTDPYSFIAETLKITRQQAKRALWTLLLGKASVSMLSPDDQALRLYILSNCTAKLESWVFSLEGMRMILSDRYRLLGEFLCYVHKDLPPDMRILFPIQDGLSLSCPADRESIKRLWSTLTQTANHWEYIPQLRMTCKTTYGSPGVI